MALPREVLDNRRRIAEPYLRGHGIEIGALHAPTELPPGASVRYVDFRTTEELRAQHPKLEGERLVAVDVIDDGERLTSFADCSLDFVIANHMLEHCENPLGTLRTHLAKVRPGGWLFYAIPEMRCCFDSVRPLTPFAHLVADDVDGGEGSRYSHFLEWEKLVKKLDDDAAAAENAWVNATRRLRIHFHVWDSNSWLEFLVHARGYLDHVFEVRHFELAGPEMVSVVRRS